MNVNFEDWVYNGASDFRCNVLPMATKLISITSGWVSIQLSFRSEFGGHDKIRTVSVKPAGAKLQELFGVSISTPTSPTLTDVSDYLTSSRFNVVQNALLYNHNSKF